MITSYVSPEGSLLYLSLVGSLDRGARDDLLREFDERVRAETRRCILDLEGAEAWEPAGLGLVVGLLARTAERRIQLRVSAGSSPAAAAVRGCAGECWTDVLPELPLSA